MKRWMRSHCRSFCDSIVLWVSQVISGHLGWVRSIAFDPGNEWFCTGSADRTIKVIVTFACPFCARSCFVAVFSWTPLFSTYVKIWAPHFINPPCILPCTVYFNYCLILNSAIYPRASFNLLVPLHNCYKLL